MNANFRNFALWIIIFLLVVALVTLFQSPGGPRAAKSPSASCLSDVDAGNIRDVTIAGPKSPAT